MTFKRISPQEAKDLIDNDGYLYLDVRTTAEFDGGHPTGASNVPFLVQSPQGMQPNPDFLSVVKGNFAPDTRLVIGCQSGNRSQRAAAELISAGYTAIVEQRAGWGGSRDCFGRVTEPGWSGAGLPTDTGPDPVHGYSSLSQNRG